MDPVPATVVIATFNRARWLGTLLDALGPCLAAVPAGSADIVVVDNGSTDATAAASLERVARLGLPVTIVHEDRPGKRFAIHTGVRAARGDLVVFADDDVVPAGPGWIASYQAAARAHPEAAFFGGPLRPWLPGRTRAPRWYGALAPASRTGLDLPEGPVASPRFIGSNWAARREAVLAAIDVIVRGRRPRRARWTSQETSLQRALLESGLQGWFVPGAGVLHRVPRHELTLAWLFRWRYKVGRGEAETWVLERGGPPRWRFREVAENLLSIGRDAGPHHRKEVLLKLARDAGFLAELARIRRSGPFEIARDRPAAAAA